MHLFFKITLFILLISVHAVKADSPNIVITGLTEDQETNVRSFLSLSLETCQSAKWRVKKSFTNSEIEISKALRALGYYQPTTSKQLIFSDDCWQVDFEINVGSPIIVTELSIQIIGEGKKDPVFNRLLNSLPIKQGDIINHGLYKKIKQKLQALASEHGYLKNKMVEKSLLVNLDTKQAIIKLIMDTGVQYKFGEITLDQHVLAPNFINKYISLFPGENYSSKKLAKTYNDLSESNYFNTINITPLSEPTSSNLIPVDINLTAAKKHAYSAGLGYDTDIGPLASLGYKNHLINEQGHNFSLDIDVSPILSNAQARYTIPFSNPSTDDISLSAGYQYEEPDTFESESAKLSLQYQHIYKNDWKQILFLDLVQETFSIGEANQVRTTLLIPGVRWQYSESNNTLRPTQGYYLNLSLSSAPESMVSDITFVQSTIIAKLITPIPWSARLITRTNLGATLVSDFDQLPASYRFYAGSIETIRGYEYKKLGPSNSAGDVIGGRLLTVVSAEYEQFITESWGVAAFIDAGNAYNTNNFDIKMGTGLGIRWVSPIGPIRLDFAIPLDEADSNYQIYFAVGAQL